ncbi:hypothetical protein NDU88_007398 [Pleurodeles waltl]|uniref:Uncharacterized protein n=1 Tax=Pleurodeles waltl TaxID=8319 RepID=A0AAV7WG20_PLEWA|nr:hypothetical protein NDU88_007398 [Pleurodeles waltl]
MGDASPVCSLHPSFPPHSHTWLCSQFLGSSLALILRKLCRAAAGREKEALSESGVVLPLLLELLHGMTTARFRGLASALMARFLSDVSFASRESVLGRLQGCSFGFLPEPASLAVPLAVAAMLGLARRMQGLALYALSLSEAMLADDEVS